MRVDQVLQAPDAFAQLGGMSVTVQLLPDTEPPEVGSTFVFFANGLVFGAGIALTEVGRQVEQSTKIASEAVTVVDGSSGATVVGSQSNATFTIPVQCGKSYLVEQTSSPTTSSSNSKELRPRLQNLKNQGIRPQWTRWW